MTLREFFVDLLEGDNLAQYLEDRDRYIDDKLAQERGLSRESGDLIRKGSLAEIEKAVSAEHNAPLRPWLMVMPP